MNSKFLFLGTGGSMGVPVVGCSCAVCQSDSSLNKRFRPSALITCNNKDFLLDSGPDFRSQCLKHNINDIEGVILTHAHHDHTSGIDEIRVFNMHHKRPIPVLLSHATAVDMKLRYPYIFKSHKDKLTSQLELKELEQKRGVVNFQGVPIQYMTFEQGGMEVNGFRFGELAYLSDIYHYPESIFEDLVDVNILIISALRFTPSAMHLSVDQAVEFSQRVGAKITWLTHISHDLDHEKTNAYLPANVRVAYDGLEFLFEA